MTQKRMYTVILSSAAILISAAAFFAGFRMDTTSAARERLAREISAIDNSINEAEKTKEELNTQISNLETELSTKDTINDYYMEYQKQYNQLTDDINTLKEQSATLDSQIEEKRGTLDRNSGVKSGTKGKSYTLKKDEIYTCPNKISAGRYTVTGSGTIVIYSSSGRPRATENLDVAYGNSYTFDLKEKEQIKVSGSATLTELK